MPENKKKKYRRIIEELKKAPPSEPFRISRRRGEVKIAPPREPTRRKKPKEAKKGEG
jgi:hypothetical protein